LYDFNFIFFCQIFLGFAYIKDSIYHHFFKQIVYIPGKKFIPLAKFRAIFMAIEMMVGPSMHSNAIAESIKVSFNINPIIIGFILAVLCGAILIGGIKRIGSFAGNICIPRCCNFRFGRRYKKQSLIACKAGGYILRGFVCRFICRL